MFAQINTVESLERSISPPTFQTTKSAFLQRRFLINNTWLGIECLVKTFDRGEDEKIDTEEIQKFLDDEDNNSLSIKNTIEYH